MPSLAIIRAQVESRIPGALTVNVRPESEMLSTGLEALDRKTGGIPRGGLTQICARPAVSSGKTTLLLSVMAEVTRREEFVALVDAGDSFDPISAEAAGVDMSRLLWVRCQQKAGMYPLEQTFKAADIIVQNGGFGLIVVDLASVDERWVRKVPLSTWFRFARVIEKMPTALLFSLVHPAAQSCAALTLFLRSQEVCWQGQTNIPQAQVLSHFKSEVEVGRVRTRAEAEIKRKPVQSVTDCLVETPVSA